MLYWHPWWLHGSSCSGAHTVGPTARDLKPFWPCRLGKSPSPRPKKKPRRCVDGCALLIAQWSNGRWSAMEHHGAICGSAGSVKIWGTGPVLIMAAGQTVPKFSISKLSWFAGSFKKLWGNYIRSTHHFASKYQKKEWHIWHSMRNMESFPSDLIGWPVDLIFSLAVAMADLAEFLGDDVADVLMMTMSDWLIMCYNRFIMINIYRCCYQHVVSLTGSLWLCLTCCVPIVLTIFNAIINNSYSTMLIHNQTKRERTITTNYWF